MKMNDYWFYNLWLVIALVGLELSVPYHLRILLSDIPLLIYIIVDIFIDRNLLVKNN